MFSQIKLASYLAASIAMTSGLLIEEGQEVLDASNIDEDMTPQEETEENEKLFSCRKHRNVLHDDPKLYLKIWIDKFAF